LPHGFMKVRHCGLLHTSCAIPLATIRPMIMQGHSSDSQPPQRPPPQPLVTRCPTCGAPMRAIRRRWIAPRALVDTGGVA
jgi:hypothetical protein